MCACASGQLDHEIAYRGEVADEGDAGEQRDAEPQRVLLQLASQLVEAPRRLVEADALVACALAELLGPHEDAGPDRLRAGVAAPYAAGEHRDP
jgi:hypothetical protein